MGTNPSSSNWIEKAALQRRRLAAEGGLLWESVRSAVQDSCDSFRQYYQIDGTTDLTNRVENGFRFIVSQFTQMGASRTTVIVYYKSDTQVITWPTDNGPEYVSIRADENSVFLADKEGKKLTPDDVSRLILEPLLFDGRRYKLNNPNAS